MGSIEQGTLVAVQMEVGHLQVYIVGVNVLHGTGFGHEVH